MVARPHGVRGWLRVRLHDAASTALSQVNELALGDERVRHKLEAAEPDQAGYRVKLEGVGDRDQAEDLRGLAVLVERARLPGLAEDQVYVADLLGCELIDAAGQCLGTVEETYNNGAYELLIVRSPAGETLVPLVPDMIRHIDVEARRIDCDLPEGLLEVNLKPPAPGNGESLGGTTLTPPDQRGRAR